MKYLIEWILKGLLTVTFLSLITGACLFMSLIMWDIRYIEISEQAKDFLWKTKNGNP
jgi:hypothetical protein